MRILYDSKKLIHNDPFGTLTPGQNCTLNIHVPASVGAVKAECILHSDDTHEERTIPMHLSEEKGIYQVFTGNFSLEERGLYECVFWNRTGCA